MNKNYCILLSIVFSCNIQSAQQYSAFDNQRYQEYTPAEDEFPVKVAHPFKSRIQNGSRIVDNHFTYQITLQPYGKLFEGEYRISKHGFKVFQEQEKFYVDMAEIHDAVL